jgi:hypothetical protein
MAAGKEPIGRMILKRVFESNPYELCSKDPAVLSCGGIYIPHRGGQQRVLYHVINTSNRSEPVKVVSGVRPKNLLREMLIKESLN